MILKSISQSLGAVHEVMKRQEKKRINKIKKYCENTPTHTCQNAIKRDDQPASMDHKTNIGLGTPRCPTLKK